MGPKTVHGLRGEVDSFFFLSESSIKGGGRLEKQKAHVRYEDDKQFLLTKILHNFFL